MNEGATEIVRHVKSCRNFRFRIKILVRKTPD